MTCGSDHYQDLLKFLEETENEISKVFQTAEKKIEANNNNYNKNYSPSEDITPTPEEEDLELDFLTQINNAIQSDISELLARNRIVDNPLDSYNIYYNINGDVTCTSQERRTWRNGHCKYSDTKLSCDGDSNSSRYSINVATQTSLPSLSPSCSTNLTWASDCSSSACSLSTSDSDLLEEDTHSVSSTDVRFQRLPHWGTKKILGYKSTSTPVLKRPPDKVNWQSRSQSDQHLAEIEAVEACRWLRATGFPQYAQLYEDHQYPIDTKTVAQDHPQLANKELVSLYRRLELLNNCAQLHLQKSYNAPADDSEDEHCALSENWTYQSDIKRWSRNCNKIGDTEDSTIRTDKAFKKNDDVFEKTADSPKDRLRRAGSSKFRRRREGVLFSDKDDSGFDSLSRQLSDLKAYELNHVSDSEVTPKHTVQSRTKSFDKPETLSQPPVTPSTSTIIWQKLPENKEHVPENHVPAVVKGPYIYQLSGTQLQVLRSLALLKLTAHMELHCPTNRTGWNWDLPKFLRKKHTTYKDKCIFGVPLHITFQKTGQVLPRIIAEAMKWLEDNAADQVGIFRKPGVKSRIVALREVMESNISVNFDDYQYFDVADMVKQYFRDLPEALFTVKLSETFLYIFQFIPNTLLYETVLCTLLLLPNENLEVLQSLLSFLLAFAKKSDLNQMDERNLAMCFAPSLFNYSGKADGKELLENKAGFECLLFLLNNYDVLFKIPEEFMKQCKSSEIKEPRVKLLNELGRDQGGWWEYLNVCHTNLLKEAKEKRGWESIQSHFIKVDVSMKKVADGLPFRLWKVSTEVEAPPSIVKDRILRERHIWDIDYTSAKIVSLQEYKSEIFVYTRKQVEPFPPQEFCVVRAWRNDLPKDACTIVETSVEYPDVPPMQNTVRGIVLASRYLIEPCGSGKSRVMHFSRVDAMGKNPEWYQKNYGHFCAMLLANLQNSFSQSAAAGPESRV